MVNTAATNFCRRYLEIIANGHFLRGVSDALMIGCTQQLLYIEDELTFRCMVDEGTKYVDEVHALLYYYKEILPKLVTSELSLQYTLCRKIIFRLEAIMEKVSR